MSDILALRPRLFGIAYRILGSISDAEDAVQSAYVRLEEHGEADLRNTEAWMVTVTTRLAVDRTRAVARQRESYVGTWLPEPIVEDRCDPEAQATQADDLAIGFLRVLERLRPEERTAMLLHDVFDYTHSEIGAILRKSDEAVRQMAARARVRVREDRPRIAIDREKAEELTDRFLHALHDADIEELRSILATDVVVLSDGGGKAYASTRPVVGFDRVSRLILGVRTKFWSDVQLHRLYVNRVPGFAVITGDTPTSVVTFDFTPDGRIDSIYIMRNPDKLVRSAIGSSPDIR